MTLAKRTYLRSRRSEPNTKVENKDGRERTLRIPLENQASENNKDERLFLESPLLPKHSSHPVPGGRISQDNVLSGETDLTRRLDRNILAGHHQPNSKFAMLASAAAVLSSTAQQTATAGQQRMAADFTMDKDHLKKSSSSSALFDTTVDFYSQQHHLEAASRHNPRISSIILDDNKKTNEKDNNARKSSSKRRRQRVQRHEITVDDPFMLNSNIGMVAQPTNLVQAIHHDQHHHHWDWEGHHWN